MRKIGIITYAYPHLKTEQIITALTKNGTEHDYVVYALPFITRKPREVLLHHRPIQHNAISPDVLCNALNIQYIECTSDTEIGNDCELYIIAGSNILSADMVASKKIINAHPGIIPAARGLDSFKWSIYNGIPLGVSLHYIDKHVDMGQLISVSPTPIFITDSLETLARRHYENEISMLISYEKYMNFPRNDFAYIKSLPATRRMPIETEMKMARLFDEYKEKFALPYDSLIASKAKLEFQIEVHC